MLIVWMHRKKMNKSARTVVNGFDESAGLFPCFSNQENCGITFCHSSHGVWPFDGGIIVLTIQLENFDETGNVGLSECPYLYSFHCSTSWEARLQIC